MVSNEKALEATDEKERTEKLVREKEAEITLVKLLPSKQDHENKFQWLPFEIILEVIILSVCTHLHQIVDFLPLPALYNFAKTCKRLARDVFSLSLAERRNVMCFHTKMTPEETILGVGVTFEKHMTKPGQEDDTTKEQYGPASNISDV